MLYPKTDTIGGDSETGKNNLLQLVKSTEEKFPDGYIDFKRTGPVLEDIKKELEMKEPDMVNHPSHYKKGGIEVIDFIMAWFSDDYCLGNVCKYITRSKHKGKELEDLKKAKWYLDKKINELEKLK